MFTGIVEKSAGVVGVVPGPKFRRITLNREWDDVKVGESIAINGVCLTVAELGATTIGFDAIAETLAKTNLGLIKEGDKVHVERAMRVGDRIDGHFVQGHVDGTGRLVNRVESKEEWRLTIEPPRELMQFMIPKGSVCLDGVSLTIAALRPTQVEVALIPTTLSITQLGDREIGWPVNIEADVLSKTIVTWLERQKQA